MDNLSGYINQREGLHDDLVAGWGAAFGVDPSLNVVDFRSLTTETIARDRSTHLLHAYPAKLIPEIPYLFLRSGIVPKSSGRLRVADPFCGSGTVLLEGILAGYDALGADTNPLARLIARVKTRPIDGPKIKRSLVNIRKWVETLDAVDAPPVVNINYWYSKRIIFDLARVRAAIARLRSDDVRDFMLVCLSVCARKLSYADPRLSVPVKINRLRKDKYGTHFTQLNNHLKFLRSVDVIEYFSDVVVRNAERLSSLDAKSCQGAKVRILDDAAGLCKSEQNSVDLIITSPPYLGAQKYIRASSLSLGWVDLAYEKDLRGLEQRTLGREHFAKAELGSAPISGISEADELISEVRQENPLRAHIAWVYLNEMETAIKSMFSILKDGASAIMVVGPNTICGRHFDTPKYIEMLAQRSGFECCFRLIDHIKSRGLMTKRNKTAGIIQSEVVLRLRKRL